MNTEKIEKRLEELREQYKVAPTSVDRKILEIRGKLLKRVLERNARQLSL